nr:immunoglobulin heavy chain junction region [Macaca mulatta]MOX91466.1 immunoglobulin heavy chain junction region [Macaca mulatta]MOX91542.1 immunoglobulin heavy chain junction region [Macaca mulatta]MOX91557.1 immunoglobulin heavy chain junction region [Macaca mulatta]MOX91706.1 immunoglobulin heavy chain junction region [Macaca mulatta]
CARYGGTGADWHFDIW